MAVLDLYSAATELLNAARSALDTTDAGAPTARYVSSGAPVFDCCDQLTVHVPGIADVPMPEAGMQSLAQMRPAVPIIQFVVTTLRCYPIIEAGVVIKVPFAAEMDAASRIVYQDGWALWNGLRTLARSDRLFAGRPCRSVEVSPLTPTPTQGGCAGWTLAVFAELDGYAPL